MPDVNLFNIYATDEFRGVAVEPTPFLRSLPQAEQITRLRKYLVDLQGEYNDAADGAEEARISALQEAARLSAQTGPLTFGQTTRLQRLRRYRRLAESKRCRSRRKFPRAAVAHCSTCGSVNGSKQIRVAKRVIMKTEQ